jgi:major inositol transporter-like SP family MFS transporter
MISVISAGDGDRPHLDFARQKGVAMTSSPTRHGTDAIPLPPLTEWPHQNRIGLISVVACLGGLLFDYDTGVTNGAEGPMATELGLSTFSEGVHA